MATMAHNGPIGAPQLHALLVITRLDVGGAQETVLALAAQLPRYGVRVTVVCGEEVEAGGAIHDDVRATGAALHVVAELRSPIRAGADLAAVRALTSLLRELRPDVVHTHSSKAGVIGRVAARRANVPTVCHTVHGWSFHAGQPRLVQATFRWVERRLASRTDALVVVSRADLQEGLREHIGTKPQYWLIRSGIIVAPFGASSERGRTRDHRVVLFVGRLVDQKDPVLVVRSFGLLAARLPDVKLRIIGDGPLRGEVLNEIARLGLHDQIELLGVQRDVRRLFADADVFVLASRWEGLPRTVLEAIAEGVPVVANDVGGVTEVVEDGLTGLLHDRTPESIAEALHRMLIDPALAARLVVSARQRLEPFAAEVMVEATASLYRQLTR